MLPQVYLTNTTQPSPRQRAIAALLYAGPGAALTGVSGLGGYGLRYLPVDSYVRVVVPADRQVRSRDFVKVHRTTRCDPQPRRSGPLVACRPARAIADAATWCAELRAVRAMVAEAVQCGLVTIDELAAEVRERARAGSGLLRGVIAEVDAGARSAPEAELHALLARSPILPPLSLNPELVAPDGCRLPTPDAWLAEVGIAIEVDSRDYHLSPADWERTMRRRNVFAEYGALVLHFPPTQIRRDPAGVLRTVERAYLARLRAGVTTVITVRRAT